MKKFSFLLLSLACFSFAASSQTTEKGRAIPSTSVKTLKGESFNTSSISNDGKPVIISFWATWCKPCLALKPKLDVIRDSYKDKGFEILSISTDEKQATLDKFFAKAKWENPVARDTNKTWAGLKVITIPALFLVKDGKVIAEFRGSPDLKALDAAVKANL